MTLPSEAIEKFKTQLVAEKQKLEKMLSSFATKDPHMKGDWDTRFPNMGEKSDYSSGALEERQDEVEEYANELSEEYALETRLKDVDDALERIEKGTYGTCAKCGKAIPRERLEANPAAATDIEHAE